MSDETASQFYEFIFRTTADGILTTDSSNRIQQVNPAAAAMLAITVEDVLGKSPQHCFGQNLAMMNLFTRSGDQVLDVRLPKRRLAVGIATSFKDGTRLVVLQDVTEQRDLESRREALISSVAHDLRNPISALDGFAELIGKFGPLNDQQQHFVNRLRQTTTKLYDVTGELVDLAWIQAGMPMPHVPIQIAQIIDRVVNQLTTLAYGRHITIAVSVQSPMPIVMGDPERIQTAIYHMLQNALIYSPSEQTVAIHAWGDEHEAYCSVADRGIGIADDELSAIFDRLYRSRDERVREISGSGLGLTITKAIIKRHGGDIWASSNLNEGSTFTFMLPTVANSK